MIKLTQNSTSKIDLGLHLFYGLLISVVASVWEPTMQPDVLYFFKGLILTGILGLFTASFYPFRNEVYSVKNRPALLVLYYYFARSLVRYNLVLYLTIGAVISFFIFEHPIAIFFQNLTGLFFAQLYVCLVSVLFYLIMEKDVQLKTWYEIRKQNPKLIFWLFLPFLICLILMTPLFNFPNMYHGAFLPPVFNLISKHPQPVLFTFLNGGFLTILALASYVLLRLHLKKSAQKTSF